MHTHTHTSPFQPYSYYTRTSSFHETSIFEESLAPPPRLCPSLEASRVPEVSPMAFSPDPPAAWHAQIVTPACKYLNYFFAAVFTADTPACPQSLVPAVVALLRGATGYAGVTEG